MPVRDHHCWIHELTSPIFGEGIDIRKRRSFVQFRHNLAEDVAFGLALLGNAQLDNETT